MTRQVLRIYEEDDETVALEFSTDPTHALPYLKVGLTTDEQEIDIRECSATIGAITCELVDVPTIPGDQDSGGLTAVLADANGETRWIGHRAEFLQEPIAGGALYPVFDGIVGGLALLDTLVTYRVTLEDITARGRKVRLFGHHETWSMLPPGPVNGFGVVRSEGGAFTKYAIQPARVIDAEYESVDATRGFFRTALPPTSVTQAMLGAAQRRPQFDDDGSFVRHIYGRIAVRWRANDADTWKTFRRIPESSEPGWDAAVRTDLGRPFPRIWVAQNPDDPSPPALPTDGQTVEVQLLYSGPPTPDFPQLIEGPGGEVLKDLLDGQYTLEWNEATFEYEPRPLRIRYDSARMTALADEVEDLFAEIVESADDAREWLQEHWFGAFGYQLTLRDGLLYPIRQEMADASPALTLDGSNVESARWGHERADAVTVVEYAFTRVEMVRVGASFLPDYTLGGFSFDQPDGTLVPAKREVEHIFRSSSIATVGEQVVRIRPVTVMELAGRGGRGDAETRSAQSIAQRRGRHLIDRLRYGAQRVTVKASRHDAAVDAANVGDWAILGASWIPEYSTLTRGANRLTQIVAARNIDPMWRELVLLDAGPDNQPLDAPTIGALLANNDGTVDVPVTAVPAGEAAIYYALSATQPPASSGLWLLAGRLSAPGTITTPSAPSGAVVQVRYRAEAPGRISSASGYDDVTVPAVPRVRDVWIELVDGTATVHWDPNVYALGIWLEYSVQAEGVDAALDQVVERDAADESYAFPVAVQPGESIVAHVTPYSGWTGTDVSGTPGPVEEAHASREALTQLTVQYASDHAGTDTSGTFDIAVHSYMRQSLDGGATWTDWFRIVGENGASSEGRYIDFIFDASATQPATPVGETPAGWSDAPPTPASGEYLWMSRAERDGIDDSLLTTWSTPVRLTGEAGPEVLPPVAFVGVVSETATQITVKYEGELGVGGTGPLEYSRAIFTYNGTINLGAGWSTYAALGTGISETIAKAPKFRKGVVVRVRDADGVESPPAFLSIDPELPFINSTTGDIESGWIDTGHIANDAITAALIADLAVNAAHVADSAITTTKLAADAVTAAKLADDAVGTEHIQALAITAAEIAASAVTTAKIAADAVTAAQLADDAVGSEHIQALAVTSAELAASAVTTAKIAADAVTAAKLADNAVGAEHIQSLAVTAAKVAASAITTEKIASAAVNADKIAAGLLVSGQNLLGADAGPEQTAATDINYGTFTLDELGLVVGDLISFAVDGYGTQVRARLDFNGPGTVQVSTTTTAAAYVRHTLQNITVPSGTTSIAARLQNLGGVTAHARRAMLNRGPLALPFEEPPVRLTRESIDQLTGQITTTQIEDNAITSPKILAGAIIAGKVAAGAIGADEIAANAIVAGKIASGAVTTAKLDALAVTAAKIAAGAIEADKILAGAVTTLKLAADAVTAEKIAAGAVEAEQIAAGAVTADKIDALAVTTAKLAAGAVTAAKITSGTITSTQIAADTITGANIAADTITASELAANSVTTAKLNALAVTAAKIAAGAIEADKILAGAVTTLKLAADAVTAEKIAAGAVEAEQIAAGAVTTAKLDALAVTAAKIAADAVTAEKIDVASLSAISANIGEITAGFLGNAGPGVATAFMDLDASGVEPFIDHPALTLYADGDAEFAGVVSSSSFVASTAVFGDTVGAEMKIVHSPNGPEIELWRSGSIDLTLSTRPALAGTGAHVTGRNQLLMTGSEITLANGATHNFGDVTTTYGNGVFIVTDTTAGESAIYIVRGSGSTQLVGSSGGVWSTSSTPGNHCVYVSGGDLILENRRGSSFNYRVERLGTTV